MAIAFLPGGKTLGERSLIAFVKTRRHSPNFHAMSARRVAPWSNVSLMYVTRRDLSAGRLRIDRNQVEVTNLLPFSHLVLKSLGKSRETVCSHSASSHGGISGSFGRKALGSKEGAWLGVA